MVANLRVRTKQLWFISDGSHLAGQYVLAQFDCASWFHTDANYQLFQLASWHWHDGRCTIVLLLLELVCVPTYPNQV